MSTELEKPQTELAVRGGDALLNVIAAAARDPNVDPAKMTALLELKERIDANNAKVEFNRAFARLMLKMPRVSKDGKIDLGKGRPMNFAKWEDVDRVIRPLLAEEGLSLSFSCEPSAGKITMTGHLRHQLGHESTSTMELPPDAGPGRNALQAIGSSHSYGKRYIALDMLNIITVGADDDGNGAGAINQDQANKIIDLMLAIEMDQTSTAKFLEFAGADSVEQIQKHRFDGVMTALRTKLRAKQVAK